MTMEDINYVEKIQLEDGRTSVAYWCDINWIPMPKDKATHAIITEYDKNGERLMEHYCSVGPKTN